jgi:hypothetical protein
LQQPQGWPPCSWHPQPQGEELAVVLVAAAGAVALELAPVALVLGVDLVWFMVVSL